ncbi:hypothetical protein ACP45F_13605, partial [Vibrio metoecus]
GFFMPFLSQSSVSIGKYSEVNAYKLCGKLTQYSHYLMQDMDNVAQFSPLSILIGGYFYE